MMRTLYALLPYLEEWRTNSDRSVEKTGNIATVLNELNLPLLSACSLFLLCLTCMVLELSVEWYKDIYMLLCQYNLNPVPSL